MYANIDRFTYSEKEIDINERTEIDRWIISELNSLIIEVEKNYEDYGLTKEYDWFRILLLINYQTGILD